MAAGRHGPALVSVMLQDAPAGTAVEIKNYVQNGITVADMVDMVENTSLGDSWKRRIPTGVRDSEAITIEGDWDTAINGPHDLRMKDADVSPRSAGRELVIIFGASKTWTRKVHMSKYSVIAQNGNVQRFSAELTPTGEAVWS